LPAPIYICTEKELAVPLPEFFADAKDAIQMLGKFMDYCQIVGKPIIERGLFA